MEEDDLVSAENDTAAAKQLIGNDLALAARLDRVLGNNDGGEPPELDEELDAENVIDAINKLFMLGNENKQTLVDNLIAMGIEASTEDTWGTLLDKILDMTDTSKDTVTAPVLFEGYTAHDSNGDLITGAMVDNAGVTVDAEQVTQDDTYTYFSIPQDGHYDQDSKVRTINSNLIGEIYDAFVAAGVTPTEQTPEALIAAVTTLKQQSYNSGKADGAASPADRAISVRGEIVNDGRGTYQGLRINFPNKGTYCQVHNQEYATWYLSQMI